MQKKITREQAAQIWDILVQHAGANSSPDAMGDFIHHALYDHWTEYRFCGKLGFGGKVWNNNNRIYVTCYREDETEVMKQIVKTANDLLGKLFS